MTTDNERMTMNTKRKPLLLIDVDGVLNAFHAIRPRTGEHPPTYRQTEVDGFTITYRPEWAEWVDDLAALSNPVWATMWQERAALAFAPATGIGKGIERHIDFDHYQRRNGQRTGAGVGDYKHPGVVATVGRHPFVWIDDDLSDWQHGWARQRTESGLPTLLVQPSPAQGLTERQYATVKRFLTVHG